MPTTNRPTALVGEFVSIPAWNVTGCVINQRPAMFGTDAAVEVLVEAKPDDPRPRWYRLEPSEYEVL